jgi:hypothetical protein
MILPDRRSIIPRTTCLAMRNAALRLVSSTSRQAVSGEMLERTTAMNPRVVDEDVDRSDLALDGRDAHLDLGRVADVERTGMDTEARRADPRDFSAELHLLNVVQDHLRPRLRQAGRHRQPEPLGRPGHQSSPPVQIKQVWRHGMASSCLGSACTLACLGR